ncbi:MAG: YjbQ family protein [Alphaproteobacteria bacterium]|nr:YjbQ family protein [Alphaproteobacteria bacterium]MBV9418708.1 YjbQ family protein [Alphaproteobacteria bacterium]MBV9541469.1 YjbQ family protein [Alphaproteobacteria bacterium]MBV9904653.1 YjbQ family protein [Alphaproteobacteria bacterium]
MRQAHDTLTVQTRSPGLVDITHQTETFVAKSGIRDGLLTAFIRHTSASLVVQENADPDVLSDLEAFMRRTVSRDTKLYDHTTEGPDDMPAHIRSALTQTSLAIPVRGGRLVLGTWQAIYVWEHRDRGHAREIALHIIGE